MTLRGRFLSSVIAGILSEAGRTGIGQEMLTLGGAVKQSYLLHAFEDYLESSGAKNRALNLAQNRVVPA